MAFCQKKEKGLAMYKLREYLETVVGMPTSAVPNDELFCTGTDMETTFLTNRMQDSLAAYTYTLVRRGWLSLVYNGQELTLGPNDLYIYSPGFQVTVLGGSEDYSAICLMADEYMTLESPTLWNIIRTAYHPVAELGEPVVHLNAEQADHLAHRMQEVMRYLKSDHRFLAESLRTLYTLFVLDLRNMMEQSIGHHHYSERTTSLFIGFIHLLTHNFIEHHDIAFYADRLHITTTHLSRIVRQISGRTVVDYINQMLLMESLWLLKTTDMPLAAIAERLHFADQSSFGKFFRRMRGVAPKVERGTAQKNLP
ncbi:MAG: AraC family transcriptional regulator [Bacteroidaceae bacterium]|nr:AraC family transcriptional regulator [Bacteroidaceae bacterium]